MKNVSERQIRSRKLYYLRREVSLETLFVFLGILVWALQLRLKVLNPFNRRNLGGLLYLSDMWPRQQLTQTAGDKHQMHYVNAA